MRYIWNRRRTRCQPLPDWPFLWPIGNTYKYRPPCVVVMTPLPVSGVTRRESGTFFFKGKFPWFFGHEGPLSRILINILFHLIALQNEKRTAGDCNPAVLFFFFACFFSLSNKTLFFNLLNIVFRVRKRIFHCSASCWSAERSYSFFLLVVRPMEKHVIDVLQLAETVW